VKERLRQIRLAWTELRKADPPRRVWCSPARSPVRSSVSGSGFLLGIWTMILFGVLFALLGAMLVFNRRLQKAQYNAIEGQTGAAAAVLNILRGQWFVAPAVAVNAKQDMVHRVVGRCGIVLVGEGAPQRVKGLLAKERKRLERVAGDAPITTARGR
jgi:hypothetical protein